MTLFLGGSEGKAPFSLCMKFNEISHKSYIFKSGRFNNGLKLSEPWCSDKVSDFNLVHEICPYI